MTDPQNTDTVDELKGKLEKSSLAYKEKLGKDLDEIIGELQKYGINILLIGGGLYISYRVVKALIGSGKEDHEKEQHEHTYKKRYSRLGDIRNTLLRHAVLYILSIAREKLVEYLDNLDLEDEKDTAEDSR